MAYVDWVAATERLRRSRRKPRYREEITEELLVKSTNNLNRFLLSPEGLIALKLLELSRKQIVLAKSPNSRRITFYLLTGCGLRRNHEGRSTRALLIPETTSPPVTAREVVEAVVTEGAYPPSLIVDHVRRELDIIASQVPLV